MFAGDSTKDLVTQKGRASCTYYPPRNPYPSYPPPTVVAYPVTTVIREEAYANEIEVDRGDHDAVLRFYRARDKRVLVKEITVPAGLLDWLMEKE